MAFTPGKCCNSALCLQSVIDSVLLSNGSAHFGSLSERHSQHLMDKPNGTFNWILFYPLFSKQRKHCDHRESSLPVINFIQATKILLFPIISCVLWSTSVFHIDIYNQQNYLFQHKTPAQSSSLQSGTFYLNSCLRIVPFFCEIFSNFLSKIKLKSIFATEMHLVVWHFTYSLLVWLFFCTSLADPPDQREHVFVNQECVYGCYYLMLSTKLMNEATLYNLYPDLQLGDAVVLAVGGVYIFVC